MTRFKFLIHGLILCGSIGFLLAEATPARADIQPSLKVGGGGIVVIGEPYLQYIFQVTLTGGTFAPLDYFMIDNVVGVDSTMNPYHSEPGDGSLPTTYGFGAFAATPPMQQFPSTFDIPGTFATSNVEWLNESTTTFQPGSLGVFGVQSILLPDGNLNGNSSVTLDYSYGTSGGQTGTGTVVLSVLTPEPSTMVIAGLIGVIAIGFTLRAANGDCRLNSVLPASDPDSRPDCRSAINLARTGNQSGSGFSFGHASHSFVGRAWA